MSQPNQIGKQVKEGIFSRTIGVLTEDIEAKRVLIVGVGSVGSYISEQLVRSGVTKLTVVDPDIVEYSNLSRTCYTHHDVGELKVDALTAHMQSIQPSVQVNSYGVGIDDLEFEQLSEIFHSADVIVATTDDPKAQRLINQFAYGVSKPAVFVGLYQGADGGEVILSVPEATPCYQCSTSIRHQLEQDTEQVSANTDYGTGKLEGVVALGVDIHHVTSAAVKLILSFLVPEDSEVKLKSFVRDAVNKNYTYLTISMTDNYWFYPHIFEGVSGQYAYQSVWLTPTRNDECSVCGNEDFRVSLDKAVLKTPSMAAIRKALD